MTIVANLGAIRIQTYLHDITANDHNTNNLLFATSLMAIAEK